MEDVCSGLPWDQYFWWISLQTKLISFRSLNKKSVQVCNCDLLSYFRIFRRELALPKFEVVQRLTMVAEFEHQLSIPAVQSPLHCESSVELWLHSRCNNYKFRGFRGSITNLENFILENFNHTYCAYAVRGATCQLQSFLVYFAQLCRYGSQPIFSSFGEI